MEVEAMHTPHKFVLTTLAMVIGITPVYAQSNVEPGLFAEANATLAHDDNIYRVTDELAQSDTYLRLTPELSAVGGIGKHRFLLSYTGDYAKFSEANEADFSDHALRGSINLEHSPRFSTHFEAAYIRDHEDPGSINRVQLDISEYNKFDQTTFLAGFAFGSSQSIGLISVDYRKTDKDYTTNDLDFWDYNSDQFSSRFTYRVAPNTRVYIEGLFTEFDYTPGANFELDNTYKRYRAGVTWDFTGKLTGDLNIGYQDRNYDLDTIRDISGLAYDGEISWAINTFTKIVASALRESIDSSLEEAGGFLRTTYAIRLNHELTDRLSLDAGAGYSSDELVFSSAREDNRYAYQLGLEYELMRGVAVEAQYTYEERDSNLSVANYKANIFGLSVKISLED